MLSSSETHVLMSQHTNRIYGQAGLFCLQFDCQFLDEVGVLGDVHSLHPRVSTDRDARTQHSPSDAAAKRADSKPIIDVADGMQKR